MKLYQATRSGICAGLIIGDGDSGCVREAAPILGNIKDKLGWFVLKRLAAKGYKVELVSENRTDYSRS
jgi:hypothetical protein